MSDQRREFLKKTAALTALTGVAGCVGVSETTETSAPTEGDGGDGNSGDGGSGDESTTTTEEEGLSVVEPENSGGTAELWHARREAEKRSLEAQIETFNGEYDQQVKPSEIAELGTKTETAIPAGKGPHSFDHAHDWAGKYYQNGWVVDASDDLRVDPDEYFTSTGADATQFDGATVGLPYAAETVGLVYNTDIVDEPPETFEEMKSIMDDYHAPSDGKYGLSYPVNSYFQSAWMHAFGGFYYDDANDELGLTNQETVDGLEFIVNQLAPYMPDSPDYGAQAEAFKQGRAPFAINGPWFLGGARDAGVSLDVTSFPTVDGNEPSPYTGVKLLFFSKQMGEGKDANATASREFIEWYTTNPDVLKGLADEHAYIPVHKELAESDDLSPTVSGYASAVSQGIPMPTNPKMQGVWGPTDGALKRAFNGQQTPKKALEQAETEVRENWNS
ncbi:substrate-binding domain-containing protein [Halorubellus litoreus]|uniref:Substrate-binding domain-containing protein n=1 Tax=Halorubellus litoreus TaxID=755308 RepID=A0ABD5VCR7_9EURY